jgi:hypothetical protein
MGLLFEEEEDEEEEEEEGLRTSAETAISWKSVCSVPLPDAAIYFAMGWMVKKFYYGYLYRRIHLAYPSCLWFTWVYLYKTGKSQHTEILNRRDVSHWRGT